MVPPETINELWLIHPAKLYEPKDPIIMRRGVTYYGYDYSTGPLWIGIELRDIRGEEIGFYYSSSPENFILAQTPIFLKFYRLIRHH